MDNVDKELKEFYDDFPYAVLYYSWDGLRIARCKTEAYMDQLFLNLSSVYTNIKKIKVEDIWAKAGDADD